MNVLKNAQVHGNQLLIDVDTLINLQIKTGLIRKMLAAGILYLLISYVQ